MRKIYISVIASILLFASCSDYLDVNSPSTFDKNYVFGSESEIATAVNGMYVPMVSGKGWVGVLLKKMLFNTDVEFSGLSTASNLNERAYVPSTGDIKSYGDIWTGMYDGVNRTNDVIEGIEQSPLSVESRLPLTSSTVMLVWVFCKSLLKIHHLFSLLGNQSLLFFGCAVQKNICRK